MITIVDYGAGNIKSVVNMLSHLGLDCVVADDPTGILAADRLILPGVGHFGFGMRALHEKGLVVPLNARVLKDKVPVLGICLGAQLMTRRSEEADKPGLGWIAADTKSFDRSKMATHLKLPHMGWADTWATSSNPLIAGGETAQRFYHVHRYHMVCDAAETEILRAQCGYEFTTGIQHENILGVQFHPEKSHSFGMGLLQNFARWDGLNDANEQYPLSVQRMTG